MLSPSIVIDLHGFFASPSTNVAMEVKMINDVVVEPLETRD